MLWIAFTLLGVTVIAHATQVAQQRAFVQDAADSIALAAVINGRSSAHQLEKMLHVTVTTLTFTNGEAIVVVSAHGLTATSSAVAFGSAGG